MATGTRARAPRLLLATLTVFLAIAAVAALSGAEAQAASGTHRLGVSDARKLTSLSPCDRARRARAQLTASWRRNHAHAALTSRRRRNLSQRLRQCSQAPAESPAAAPATGGGPLYWGAWIGSQLTGTEAPWDMGAVSKFEEMTGKSVSVINFSSPFADCSVSPCSFYKFPAEEMEAIREHGAIPFFSWASQSTPASLNEPEFQLSDVIAGTYDSYIREFAEEAAAWGHPFFLRFNWEMNGNWFAWDEGVNGNQPGEYVAAWRHVHDIFAQAGATNVTWVWCPNVDPRSKLKSLASLYPGNEYVDWTGLDGYNWGTNPASPRGWMSFNELFRSTYDEITETIAPSKPMIISEIGSSEYGGSKAAWISEALESARTEYPQLRGLVWFEKYDDGMDWPIETSSSATSAFAAGIQNPAYLPSSFASLPPGTIQPAG